MLHFTKRIRGGAGGGFTLIELLVVIAIIGVLASIVLASLNSARLRSRDARRVTDIKQLQLALELFFDSKRAYPTTAEGLAILAANGHIPTIPKDPLSPATGACRPIYCYVGRSDVLSYHLGANLEDSGNIALPGKDCNSINGGGCPGTGWTSGFDGAAGSPSTIYDVVP